MTEAWKDCFFCFWVGSDGSGYEYFHFLWDKITMLANEMNEIKKFCYTYKFSGE